MKTCVYAICKNESKFIERWYNSVKDADYVCVLDTGSTDDSFDKLRKLPIITKQKKYKSFRFDVARNDSLKLVPKDADICICIDLDEVMVDGWNKTLKQHWTDKTTQAKYRYTWNFNDDGSEGIVFMSEKIHKNGLFKWENPVHEVLKPISDFTNNIIELPTIQVNHLADITKSRSNYLPLLELSVKENPNNDRNMHYLGREYMFYGEYDKAIETLKKHLTLPSAIWNLERSASLRYIANCYKMKQDFINQEKYLHLAILEANTTREPYFELAVFYYNIGDFLKSAYTFNEMFKITNRVLNYMSSPVCWGSLPYDYLSICYYELGDYKNAILTIDNAIKLNPEQRLISNKNLFLNKYKDQLNE